MATPNTVGSVLAATLVFLLASAALGDEQLRPPETYTRCSLNGQFCAEMSAETGQTIIRQGGKEIWRMKGWFADAHLADDGEHFVVGHWGLSLLPVNFSPRTAVVIFYRRGELIRKVHISGIFRDINSLPLTGGHRLWGRTLGFDASGRFVIKTTESRAIAFDATNGNVVEAWFAPWGPPL